MFTRSSSRHRSHSHSPLPPAITYSPSQAMPIPSTSVMPSGYAGSYGGGYGSYPYSQQPHYGSPPMLSVPSSSYGHRHRSTSVSVPMAYSPTVPTVGVPIVLSSSGRSHRHKHSRSHSSSKRSRSMDPTMRIEYPGYPRSGY
jgi:hypothetical protein